MEDMNKNGIDNKAFDSQGEIPLEPVGSSQEVFMFTIYLNGIGTL